MQIDKLRPQSKVLFFPYDLIYNDDDSISLDIADDQFITTDEILRYNLKTNQPETPPSSLLSLNYHIVDERHSTDDHVGRVGNDDAKDYNIHEVGMGIKSLFLFNYDNDRNINDIDGLYYDDDDGTEDDNNDIFD